MFSKKKKKIEISAPSNFQHRVHTGFDNHSNKFVGLPKQWASLVDDKPAAQSPYRPSPMVDPSTFTPEALDSRGQDGNHRLMNGSGSMASSVVRSNSLRSNSPPQIRRQKPMPPQLPPVLETSGDAERFAMMHIQPPLPNQQSPNYPQPPQYRPVVPPGMMSNRSSVSDQQPPPLQVKKTVDFTKKNINIVNK